MTTNAFIFSWDSYGIESIIPITKYENTEKENIVLMLKGQEPKKNDINRIISNLKLRAMYNNHRHYEIYAIDCTSELTEDFWKNQWQEFPQETADLVRIRGYKIHSDRNLNKPVIT